MNFGKINAQNIHYLKYFCHLECYGKKYIVNTTLKFIFKGITALNDG